MALVFPFDKVLKMVDFNQANNQSPTFGDLYDGSFYPGGKVVYKDGMADGWPDGYKIDQALLNNVRSLHLVGDQGVYLMAGTNENMPIPEGCEDDVSKGCSQYILYAEGCHPDKDEDFYERKRQEFGGDDGTENIPIKTLLYFKEQVEERKVDPCKASLVITLTPKSIDFKIKLTK